MFNNYYQGKRVLVTGHTGFKGGWLSLWLKQLGAEVHGLSWDLKSTPNFYEFLSNGIFKREFFHDIAFEVEVAKTIAKSKPDIIFHLAAQPLVGQSYKDPLGTLIANALGTANVLESVRQLNLPCPVIIITSDKCYENREWEFAYRENDPLGGHDVYSASKACAEIIAQAWNRSFFRGNLKLGPVITARAGNVIGGGDYAPDRLVPDCIRSLIKNKPIVIRNPKGVRPWQHVLDCLSGYLWLGARASEHKIIGSCFNFGPGAGVQHPVLDVVNQIVSIWPGKVTVPKAKDFPHEARTLSLSTEKAEAILGWRPTWSFQEAVEATVLWYIRRHRPGQTCSNMLEMSRLQIQNYTQAAQTKQLPWTK